MASPEARRASAFFASSALVALASPAAPQTGRLFPGARFDVGPAPAAIAVGHLNGDALPDAVVANSGGGKLSLLLGDGSGAFLPALNVNAGPGPSSVALADLGGDGQLDAVAATPSSGSLAVLAGDGQGGLGAPVAFTAGPSPLWVELGDIDLDGAVDALVAGGYSDTVSMLLGDEAGGFAAPLTFASPGYPVWLRPADLDADGDLDLAVALKGASLISTWTGDGQGGFSPSSSIGVGAYPEALSVGDVDEDAWVDLAVAATGMIAGPFVLLGGPAGFSPALGAGTGSANSVALADVDADGHLDLCYTPLHVPDPYSYLNALVVKLGDGAGNFAAPAGGLPPPLGSDSRDLSMADFDQDGALDALSADSSGSSVSLVRGDGKGSFEMPASYAVAPAGPYTHAIRACPLDADADGDLDLAFLLTTYTGPGSGDGVAVALGDGQAGFAAPAQLYTLGLWTGGFASGDFDGEGDIDLAAGRYGGPLAANVVHVFLAGGTGSFTPTGPFPAATAQPIGAIQSADFDLDGDLDLVCCSAGFPWDAPSVDLLLGDGAGGFGAPAIVATGNLLDLAARDFDGDGWTDLAGASFYDASLQVLRATGPGSFGAPTSVAVEYGARSVLIADLNGDGKEDLVGSGDPLSAGLGSVSFHAGDGAGGFASGQGFAAGLTTKGLALGDFDADGRRDVACGHPYSSTAVSVLAGNGAGGFLDARNFLGDGSAEALVAADVDADGRIDLAVTHRSDEDFWLYRNGRDFAQGLLSYGSGTSGCAGGHGLNANGEPAVGNASFRLLSTNAPKNGLGLRVLSLAPDFAGSDPFGLGFLLHVDPAAGGAFLAFNFKSDELALGSAPLPIPSDPALAGQTAFAQALWIWTGPCQPAPLGISSSDGLRITLQP